MRTMGTYDLGRHWDKGSHGHVQGSGNSFPRSPICETLCTGDNRDVNFPRWEVRTSNNSGGLCCGWE